MRRRNTILAVALIAVAVLYFAYDQSGSYFSARSAFAHSASYPGQSVAYERALGSDKIAILTNGSQSKAQIVHRKWGLLYEPGTSVEMAALQGRESVRYAWFSAGAGEEEGKIAVVFAAESFDPAVKTVIVSNDTLADPAGAADVKQASTVYVELEVGEKYAIATKELGGQDVGSFVVRAADANGKILTGA
ncbi:hypothetical protein I8J29_25785 [Paenibacillus sp. MWE-103]|uniref:Uncharacterized protein n=1 Tax=Paenibacillus artemisiicola TaxID=1172618 RepID=A0ABS3WH05_9BACL|nr:hypothetical protein [Paenibacillus artemisiicola]MBO7747604.1 hypothetical protein [Paenibacillus artemisiicola]